VITQNRQVTLAVYPVTKGTSKVVYIARCLDAITTKDLKILALCLDREFYTRKVIDFLTTVQIPFIIPVKKHSRAMKQLLNGTKSRFGEYFMRGKPLLHLTIAINVTYANGKRGKQGVENLGYVIHGIP